MADFTPCDPWLAMKVDEIVNCCTDYNNDFKNAAMACFGAQGPDPAKFDLSVGANTAALDKWFGYMENRVKENGSTGFAVGNDMTNADIAIWRIVDCVCDWYPIPGLQ
jgi:hypothetical protein